MRLAIVYDWIDKWGGAERILQTVFDTYPKADVYTLYADFSGARWAISYKKRIRETFLRNFYRFIPKKQWLVPLMPFAIESLNLSEYDAVLSISSSFAKGVLTRPETKHLCYLFAPTRFLWLQRERYTKDLLGQGTGVIKLLRRWDAIASTRPDEIITLSAFSSKAIKGVYNRSSTILPPPFDTVYFKELYRNDTKPFSPLPSSYFLYVGRLEPYKRVDLILDAWKKGREDNLVIVGSGTEEKKLKTMIRNSKNITVITKHLSDAELMYTYKHARALIMPQAEDFGYTALEALYAGTPVVSYKFSGASEMIIPGENGVVFDEQNIYSINKALDRVITVSYNRKEEMFERFSKGRFLKELDHKL